MNKTESIETLKRRLDALETEAAELRKALEAPEPVEKKPLIWTDQHNAWLLDSDEIGCVQNQKVAARYAEAFNTLLDLRRQPGSEAAVDGKAQWFIDGTGRVFLYSELHLKLSEICPPFDSKTSARAALAVVGWDRIKRMYYTLHGRGYD